MKIKGYKIEQLSRQSGIYIITNISNNKRYVGSAVNLRTRYSSHIRDLIRNTHKNILIQNSFNKYKEENFEFGILEFIIMPKNLTKEEIRKILLEREQHYIDVLDPEFNICKIAGNTMGTKLSESAKQKIREANTGRETSLETREKLSISSNERYKDPAVIEYRRRKQTGKKYSEESKLKMSNAHKGKKLSEETRKKMGIKKRVAILDSNNNIIKIFETLVDAKKYTNVSKPIIKLCCMNKNNKLTNYIFVFVDKNNNIIKYD